MITVSWDDVEKACAFLKAWPLARYRCHRVTRKSTIDRAHWGRDMLDR